jgi:hypothetical protein
MRMFWLLAAVAVEPLAAVAAVTLSMPQKFFCKVVPFLSQLVLVGLEPSGLLV